MDIIGKVDDSISRCIDPAGLKIIEHVVHSDPEEPGSIALALGRGRYIYNVIKQIHPSVTIKTNLDTLLIRGRKRQVYEAARLVEYFLESPRKRCGTMIRIPTQHLDKISEIRSEISRITRYTKGKILECLNVKTNQTYVFAVGLPHLENQYRVNTYLNDLLYNKQGWTQG